MEQQPPPPDDAGEPIMLADVISIADLRSRSDSREGPLTRQELRQLRRLAGAADDLLKLVGLSQIGAHMCPTYRRIEEEHQRRQVCSG